MPRQLPVDGAEHRVFHVEPLGQGDLHQVHEGRRAHQHLLVADDGGQAALIHAEVGGAAVHAPLGAEQVVEELVQPAAASRIRVAVSDTPCPRKVPRS